MQFYSDPSREHLPHALPDCEVFEMTYQDFIQAEDGTWMKDAMENECLSNLQNAATLKGYYWQACFPGCLPDGEPDGPFSSEALAIADAQDGAA